MRLKNEHFECMCRRQMIVIVRCSKPLQVALIEAMPSLKFDQFLNIRKNREIATKAKQYAVLKPILRKVWHIGCILLGKDIFLSLIIRSPLKNRLTLA